MLTVYYNLIAVSTYMLSCYALAPIDEGGKRTLAFKRSMFNFVLLLTLNRTELPVSPSLVNVLLWYPLSESIFSVIHHCLHFKPLYWIHKQHHEHEIPCSTSCFDAHPIEFFMSNVMSYALPIYIFPGPLYMQVFALVITVVNTVLAHCSPGVHRIHHQKRKYNFGFGTYTYDKIMNTYYS
jgi:sterol desaturase/sphingolipid hydroxylase (fatty acid hydroxylase superfamily)